MPRRPTPEWTSESCGDQRQVVLERRGVERPGERGRDATFGVDEEGGGQASHAVRLVAAHHDRPGRVRMLVNLLEAAEPARRVLVVGAHEGDTGMAGGAVGEHWQLLHARRAPRRPEVHHHRLAMPLSIAYLLTAYRLDTPLSSGLPHLPRYGY